MSLPYKVMNIDNVFKIKELATEQYVAWYSDFETAKRRCKELNLGAGFDGHTPKFIAEYVDNKEKEIL